MLIRCSLQPSEFKKLMPDELSDILNKLNGENNLVTFKDVQELEQWQTTQQ